MNTANESLPSIVAGNHDPLSGARLTTRVLCVGGDATSRTALARTLAPHGFELDLATSGLDALGRLQQRRYPLVVVDEELPGVAGIALVQRLQPLYPDSRFLLLTDEPEFAGQGCIAEADTYVDVVAKPCDEMELVRKLHCALELGGAVRAQEATTILLVEDNSAESELVMHHLSVWPHAEPPEVTRVSSLGEAVSYLHGHSVDMILTDLSMSDAAGLDAVRRLRTASPGAAVLVLTGLADEELGLRAIQLGADDYLSKTELTRVYLTRAIRRGLERNRTSSRLAQLALRDHLTGLANRTAFMERLQHALTLCKRCERQIAVGFLDLDKFKEINDTFGHDAGDSVLQQVACRLESTIRNCDMVARLGGDEFAFILEDVSDEKTLGFALERIQSSLDRPLSLEEHGPVQVGCSIGVALYPDGGETVDSLLRAADRAMYSAKQRSGSTFEVHSVGYSGRRMPRFRLQAALRKALSRHELELHYQPLHHLKQDKVVALEALLRWNPQGAIGDEPAVFIPVLEDTGMIVDVGRWVLRTACAQIRRMVDAGYSLRVAVNISPLQFAEGDLPVVVDRALGESGVDPELLELEITERLLMQDSAKVERVLGELKEMGVRLSLDDFGTGYSSLSYLNRFAVDVLKIDRVFAQQISEGPQGASVTTGIIELGRRLGLEIVAEGVESYAQLDFFARCGCDMAQGYLFGAPSPSWPVCVDAPLPEPRTPSFRLCKSIQRGSMGDVR